MSLKEGETKLKIKVVNWKTGQKEISCQSIYT